jgi:hypothetical protein
MQTIKATYNGEFFVPFTPVCLPKDQVVYITPVDAEEEGYCEPEHFNAETIAAMEDVLAGRNLYGPYKTVAEMFAAMDAEDKEEEVCLS